MSMATSKAAEGPSSPRWYSILPVSAPLRSCHDQEEVCLLRGRVRAQPFATPKTSWVGAIVQAVDATKGAVCAKVDGLQIMITDLHTTVKDIVLRIENHCGGSYC